MKIPLHAQCVSTPPPPRPPPAIGDPQSFTKKSSAASSTTATLEYHELFAYTTVDEDHVFAQSVLTRSVMLILLMLLAGFANSSRSPLRRSTPRAPRRTGSGGRR